MLKDTFKDKCRGALVGGAIGDALGYPVEFVNSFEAIRAEYGEDGITEYDKRYPWLGDEARHCVALISDDTQMTLYTAEGLLEAEQSGKEIIPEICQAYLAWCGKQIGKDYKISYESELSQIEELNQRRAPGNTCISSLMLIQNGKKPMNSSKGCGGVMRVAPIGIYGASQDWPLEKTARLAAEAAELTHQHPLSTYSSAALALIVQLCLSNDNVDPAKFKSIVKETLDVLTRLYGDEAPNMADFKRIIEKAIRLEDNLLRDWEVIENGLGGGWVAEETLAIAIFSVIRHINDFKACLIAAVNHGGDSDSTGAVAGNIIGAILGYSAIPESFKKDIQFHDLLILFSDRLSAGI